MKSCSNCGKPHEGHATKDVIFQGKTLTTLWHPQKAPAILYRGASSNSLSSKGLNRTGGIPLMYATDEYGTAAVYAREDHVAYYGGRPIVVKFKTAGLDVRHDPIEGFWQVHEDIIPSKNIVGVEYEYQSPRRRSLSIGQVRVRTHHRRRR